MAALFMSATVSAHDIAVENEDGVTIYYIFINKRTELFVSYQGDDYHSAVYKGSVVIPESVIYNGETYPVTGISDMAFSDCSDLTSVTIPESVTTIASGAFQECSALTAITIPLSLTSISSGVFRNCSALTAITIPESVTSIGGGAFSGCSGLTSISIPRNVTKIEDSIFNRCSGLTSVTLPESVTAIGNAVFQYCSSLTSITIPRNVTTIGSWAFAYCSCLSSITIPKNVDTIGSRIFLGCTNLTSISVAAGNKYYEVFVATVDSGVLDAVTMEPEDLSLLGESGRLMDLRDERCGAIYEKYKDRLIYSIPYDKEYSTEPVPVGIDISDSILISKYHIYTDGCALGIGAQSSNIEAVEKFLDYIYEGNKEQQ